MAKVTLGQLPLSDVTQEEYVLVGSGNLIKRSSSTNLTKGVDSLNVTNVDGKLKVEITKIDGFKETSEISGLNLPSLQVSDINVATQEDVDDLGIDVEESVLFMGFKDSSLTTYPMTYWGLPQTANQGTILFGDNSNKGSGSFYQNANAGNNQGFLIIHQDVLADIMGEYRADYKVAIKDLLGTIQTSMYNQKTGSGGFWNYKGLEVISPDMISSLYPTYYTTSGEVTAREDQAHRASTQGDILNLGMQHDVSGDVEEGYFKRGVLVAINESGYKPILSFTDNIASPWYITSCKCSSYVAGKRTSLVTLPNSGMVIKNRPISKSWALGLIEQQKGYLARFSLLAGIVDVNEMVIGG